jgi:hypothetical protein
MPWPDITKVKAGALVDGPAWAATAATMITEMAVELAAQMMGWRA